MLEVNITFPALIEPCIFEHEMEEAVRQNSGYRIKVRFTEAVEEHNSYSISTESKEAVFLAGVAAGKLMCQLRR